MPSYKKVNETTVFCIGKKLHQTAAYTSIPRDWIGKKLKIELLEEADPDKPQAMPGA